MPQMNLSKKKARVYDLGLFTHLAAALAEGFGTVEYFTPSVSAFSTPDQKDIGVGFPGLTRINSFEDDSESVDIWVFFDVGYGDVQERLRREGKRVFGCGRGEILETDRIKFREILAGRGLPVGPYKVVTGIEALSKAMKEENDKWIKVNNDARGILESFHHKDWIHSVDSVHKWSTLLGYKRDTQKFLIEDPIHPKDGVEPGADRFFTNGQFLSNLMYGFECKGAGYACQQLEFSQLPKPIRHVDEVLQPVYKKLGIMGMMSSEVRIGPDKKPYFGDACQRAGRPPSGITSARFTNFPEMVWKIASGEDVTPEYDKKKPFAAEVIVTACAPEGTVSIPLDFKDKDLSVIKFGNACKVGNQWQAITKNCGFMAECIGFGEVLEEAQMNAMDAVNKIECQGKEYNAKVFEELEEKLEMAGKYGVGFK